MTNTLLSGFWLAWQQTDFVTGTVIMAFLLFSAWVVLDGLYRYARHRLTAVDYEPRATPSERGIW